MVNSKTQRARQLYLELRESIQPDGWVILMPGLYRYKWRWVWVAKGDRAYWLKEVSDSHLSNLITALITRHPSENRKPLINEYRKRRLFKNWHPDTASLKPRGL